MSIPIGPWQAAQDRSERLLREAQGDRLLAASADASTAPARLLRQLSALLIAAGRRLAPPNDAGQEEVSGAGPSHLPLPVDQRIALNGTSLAALRAELLASEFASTATSSVVVVRMELAQEERVSVFCWDSGADEASAERRVALLLTAPSASAEPGASASI